MTEIRWHGRGGQGAKTMSHVLAVAHLEAGWWVQVFPEYGPERSGAPMMAFNRFSPERIRRRCGVKRPAAVAVLDASLPGEVDVCEGLSEDSLLLVNSPEEETALQERLGFGGRVLTIPADRLAREAGARVSNVVVLGALARALGTPPLDLLRRALGSSLGAKLAGSAWEATATALAAGYQAVEGNVVTRMSGEVTACPS